ncbi:ShlB/FhaC/HecB family hemolysin secretion/activation protein [Vampirovibrio sp.]|uniref:ShlB/FhaC/HecB family hemolysin secretion/activation protein n=1 Tax=Vampirovibrio sp. TaxID=2717857 RepID=UPI003592E8F6
MDGTCRVGCLFFQIQGRRTVLVVCFLSVTFLTPVGFAQNSLPGQSAPASLNPGLLTQPSGQMRFLDQQGFSSRQAPAVRQEEIKLDVPAISPPAHFASAAFPIQKILIEGATLLSKEEANRLTRPYEGTPQTLDSLGRLVEQITGYYREKGYLTTEAFIPPQDVKEGVLRIQVQEGRVGNIHIEGSRFYRVRVIGRNLSQQPGEPLNFRKLERDLNASNRLNDGYKVKAFLSPGDQPGATNIKLKVAERQPLQVSPTFDNQGRYFVGLYRAGVEVRNDSLFRAGDRLYGRYLGATGTQVGVGTYSVPLNRFGTEVSGSFAYSRVNVKLPIDTPPSITGKSYSAGVNITQPLGRSRSWQLDTGFNWQRATNFFEGDQTNAEEVHSIQTGLSFDHSDRWGRTFNRVQNTFAFKGTRADNSFWKVENFFNRLILLPKNNLLILKAYGQWTPDALSSLQQFQLGGQSSVRGFTEGVLIGDRGYNLGIEHRFPLPGLKYVSPWMSQRVQGALFYDLGQVWNDKSSPFYNPKTATLAKATLLQGVGFGFRAQLTRFMQGFVDVGFGLGDRRAIEPEGRQPTARVHFGLRSDFLPTEYKIRNEKSRLYKQPKPPKKSASAV